MSVEKLTGTQAAKAWAAYLANRGYFGGAHELEYAASLPTPAVVFFHLADAQQPLLCGVLGEEATAKHIGKEASATLLLSAPVTSLASTVTTLLYIHVRSNQQGGGIGSLLLDAAKRHVGEGGVLRTRAPACRTHYATLLLLRNGFTSDLALFQADIPLPGETPTPGSSQLDFSWSASIKANEQLAFVRTALAQQARRRSERAREFSDALRPVVQRLEERR